LENSYIPLVIDARKLRQTIRESKIGWGYNDDARKSIQRLADTRVTVSSQNGRTKSTFPLLRWENRLEETDTVLIELHPLTVVGLSTDREMAAKQLVEACQLPDEMSILLHN